MRLHLILFLISSICLAQSPTPKISTYFQYEGYTKAVYKGHQKSSQYVTLSDGVKLAVDIFIPNEGPTKSSFPTVFMYTPYNRAYFIPKMGLVKHGASAITGNGWGPVYDMSNFDNIKNLLAHGYAFIIADMRGTGASFGSQMPMMPQLGKDGKEMVDWIARQDWCDGNVGMMGPSYLGWAQFLTAGQQPKALKCIIPEVMGFDMYTSANRPGGIAATRWLKNFSSRLTEFNQNAYNFKRFVLPCVPVVDEDGDGKIVDERPLLDSAMLAGQKELKYKDNSLRAKSIYFSATQEHLDNIPVSRFLDEGMQYFDSQAPEPYQDLTFFKSNPGYYLPEFMESQIPVYNVGGWLDGFVRGTTKLYASMAGNHPAKLMISPRAHFPAVPKAYKKYQNYKEDYAEQLMIEQLRFFDFHLKGIDNGMMDEPPVNIYVMNKGWRTSESWPLPEQEVQSFYFEDNYSLSQTSTFTGIDSRQVDFTHTSSYGKGFLNRWQMYTTGPKEVMNRTDQDPKCITYETNVLTEEIELIGHPIINFWASSNQAYGDFFVYLCDVDEKGTSTYVTEGQLRAGWHQSQDPKSQIDGRAEVKPELPWHGYKQNQWADSVFADGQIVELRFDLMPIAWVFKPGHKIRIAIANVDRGNFELNPYLCPDAECPETQINIHRSPEMLSRIELPIIPKEVIKQALSR